MNQFARRLNTAVAVVGASLVAPAAVAHAATGYPVVDLPAVTREQIIGVHRVCVVGDARTVRCLRGPADAVLQRSVQVAQIIIDKPTA